MWVVLWDARLLSSLKSYVMTRRVTTIKAASYTDNTHASCSSLRGINVAFVVFRSCETAAGRLRAVRMALYVKPSLDLRRPWTRPRPAKIPTSWSKVVRRKSGRDYGSELRPDRGRRWLRGGPPTTFSLMSADTSTGVLCVRGQRHTRVRTEGNISTRVSRCVHRRSQGVQWGCSGCICTPRGEKRLSVIYRENLLVHPQLTKCTPRESKSQF